MSTEMKITVDFERQDNRYERFGLIPWWNQELLRDARVLVVGAGAIGNEVLKNLALLGVGNIFVVDLDLVENSNLSRSVLFRVGDEGRAKAEVAAQKIRELNPDVKSLGIKGDICTDIGLGLFRYVDLVIGGLDNREARLVINEKCWKAGKPWIDGATETIVGLARVFMPPDTACYECTLNELDYKLLNMRRSCGLLKRGELVEGKVPTTPTTSSVVAGIQVQEAVKMIHRMDRKDTLAGRGYFFNGQTHDSYVIEYRRKTECLAHYTYDRIEDLDLQVGKTTAGDLLELARTKHGVEAVIALEHECMSALVCRQCRRSSTRFGALGKMSEKQAKCPGCGRVRVPELFHRIDGGEPFLDRTLAEIGLPVNDIITVSNSTGDFYYELAGDRKKWEV